MREVQTAKVGTEQPPRRTIRRRRRRSVGLEPGLVHDHPGLRRKDRSLRAPANSWQQAQHQKTDQPDPMPPARVPAHQRTGREWVLNLVAERLVPIEERRPHLRFDRRTDAEDAAVGQQDVPGAIVVVEVQDVMPAKGASGRFSATRGSYCHPIQETAATVWLSDGLPRPR
jgi:hypothetical protein